MTNYNIVLLGSGVPGALDDLRDHLTTAITALGLTPGAVAFPGAGQVDGLPRNTPTVAVFFAPSTVTADTIAATQLHARGVPIIPVVADLKTFGADAPPVLHAYNGFEIGAGRARIGALASAVLEWLGLLRRQRRLFLSYYRDESEKAAIPLYNALQAAGFDVFLDTHVIRPGDDFQGVLMHRLLDCEIVVLLDTPGFRTRRWTVEELARANLLGIGILQIIWPGHTADRASPISMKLELDAGDLEAPTGPFAKGVSDRIIAEIEDLRARVVATRTAALAGEFALQADRAGAQVIPQSNRSLLARWPDGRTMVALPTLGVPSADRYHEVYDNAVDAGLSPPVLIYDHTGVLQRWLQHLDWLDEHLPLKTLRVADIPKALAKL
ncbi:toll/interleukin-1 receptor domain-containing protein [Brevundimonas diminuta]|uniref:toll/interleukin-1 receptor domain-containing protein n=1 Tax=Brevundimonas diminuta TaxID=293 RepID=UPI003F7F8678